MPPLTTRPKAATVGVGRQVILRPAVQKRYLELAEPSLADQASDLERVLAQLDDLEPRAELSVLKTLGRTLREADYKVTAVVVDDVLIAVEPGDTTARRFGIAFDLGTTTVVATLLDLSTGTPAGVESALNSQQPFGADVITRISATMMDPGALDKLQNLAHETLAELAQAVCAQGGVEPDEVYEVAVAGNATMTHLVLGIDPEPLGMAPFIMATRLYPEVLAADLGLGGVVHPRARAVVFPAFGAYVGGDITAGLLASGMDRDARVRLFVDIGTNCEIVLGNRDWLLATAAPAGPAFEGAAIRCGMRAADGAIEVVTMTPDELTLKVIGDVEPQGLCGSGLVDAVTGLVRVGLLDSSGRFISEEAARDVARAGGPADQIGKERVFVLHWRGPKPPEDSIYLSQRDVRELQFAKAAIATGWQILLEEAGLTAADVKQVLLAGSFGSYLSPASAIRIGLVPEVPVMRVVSAGNVAGEGAKMALLSLRERAGGLALLEEVRYVELSDRADFNDRFVEQLPFPPGGEGGVPPGQQGVEIVACGALAGHIREIVARRGWPAAVTPLPAVLHNRPQKIVIEAERAVASALASGRSVALAYADCGTYGALDELCSRYGVRRLPGLHCYDVFAGAEAMAAMFEAEPGTYVLTDFLLRSFDRSVLAELGLDRYPELWDDYFGHYTRLVWLAQEADSPALEAEADRVAGMFGLPLTRVDVGVSRLEQALQVRSCDQPARAAVRAAVRGDPGQGHRAGRRGMGARRDDRRGHRLAGQGPGADHRAGREAGRAGLPGGAAPGRPFGGQPGAPGRDRGPAEGVRDGRRVRAGRRRRGSGRAVRRRAAAARAAGRDGPPVRPDRHHRLPGEPPQDR